MQNRTLSGIIRELYDYRVFLKYKTLGNVKVRHKGSYLGYIWWLLDPLFFLGIYYFMFGILFQRGGPDYVVFLFCALLPWRWFSASVMESATSVRASGGLLKQVYFPKIVIPLSAVFTNTISFGFGLTVLAGMLFLFDITPGLNILWFPLVVFVQFTFATGLGLIFADFTVFTKDLKVLLGHVMRLWFYLSPGVYGLELVPERFLPVYMLNPFATLFTSYRDVLMYNRTPDLAALFLIFVVALGLIIAGTKLIAVHQGQYAKIL